MTPVEVLEAALKRLDGIKNRTVDGGEITEELVTVALAMFLPVERILRTDIQIIGSCTDNDMRDKIDSALDRAGDLALAHAILGDTK